jgi:hypothetical protein
MTNWTNAGENKCVSKSNWTSSSGASNAPLNARKIQDPQKMPTSREWFLDRSPAKLSDFITARFYPS